MQLRLLALAVASTMLVGCATTPTADNYQSYVNDPNIQHGASGNIDSMMSNQAAWNNIKITQMTSVRRMPSQAGQHHSDANYATGPSTGLLSVRAVLVNSGEKPAQGNWRCRFFDSNGMPLYEKQSNQTATTATGLGWHSMVVYPLTSKTQTADANVIHCQAGDSKATTYRIEFHDTQNDITVYHR
jgi:hypothetical protein